MAIDPVTSHGGAAAIGAAAIYAWVKVGPVLIAKLGGNGSNGNGNGNGNGATLELKMQTVMERVGSNMMGPINASVSRMEAAMTRMETNQNNMHSTLAAFVAAEQARALSDIHRHGD